MKIIVIYFDYFPKSLQARLKENKIEADFVKNEDITKLKYIPDVAILSGSSKRILKKHNFSEIHNLIMNNNIIVIGICFGFHLMSFLNDGKIIECPRHKKNEKISENLTLYYNHKDRVVRLPKNWKIIDEFENFINIATYKNMIGYQFHPEKHRNSFDIFLLPFQATFTYIFCNFVTYEYS